MTRHPYTGQTAHLMAQIAAAVYEADKVATERLSNLGFRLAESQDLVSTHSLIALSDSTCVIAYRGTSDIFDFLTDARIRLKPVEFDQPDKPDKRITVHVHVGFWRYTMRTWVDIAHWFVLQPKPLEVFFAGHSLGAAACTIAAIKAKTLFARSGMPHQVCGVYLYGSPKVGSTDFAQFYDRWLADRTYRHEYNNDPVCFLPWKLGKYRHVAKRNVRYFTYNRERLVAPPWTIRLSDQRRGALKFLWNVFRSAAKQSPRNDRFCVGIAQALVKELDEFDHFMVNYLKCTELYADETE